VNSQTVAPIRLRLNSIHGHPVITDGNANDTDEAIRTSPEVRSSREDSSQEKSTPSSFESSQDFVTRRRAAFNNDGGNDGREHFVFPDPLSRATDRGTSSDVIDAEPTESSSSENTIIEAKLAADLCGSPRQTRTHKGKGIARDPAPSPKPQEPTFLPLLKEDSHFPKQPEHEKQSHKSRSSSFHSKLANLNKNIASATLRGVPEQPARSREAERNKKTLRHLQLQTLIQSDQIKSLKLQTQDLAAALERLQGSTARDIQHLEESGEVYRENSDRLVGVWEGMRRELLDLKVRMMQERFGQRVVSRARGEEEDGNRRGTGPDVTSPPLHGLLQPTPMDYAFAGYPPAFFDPRNSDPPSPMTTLNPNNMQSMPGETVAGPSFSRPPPVSHGVGPDFAYNSVPLQYWDGHRESHIMLNPQGCRWHYCSVCRGGGEMVTGFE
jgi:hypothetical protein